MNYTRVVDLIVSPEKVFEAITQNLQDWWGTTDFTVEKIGEEFTTSFGPTFWKFRISEYQLNEKLVWDCIDARHVHVNYLGIEKEWIGTKVIWTIKPTNSGSQLFFQHDGLVPELNCHEICTPAWDRFVGESLKAFLETGKGMPYLA